LVNSVALKIMPPSGRKLAIDSLVVRATCSARFSFSGMRETFPFASRVTGSA
jgi:hypothetical protein